MRERDPLPAPVTAAEADSALVIQGGIARGKLTQSGLYTDGDNSQVPSREVPVARTPVTLIRPIAELTSGRPSAASAKSGIPVTSRLDDTDPDGQSSKLDTPEPSVRLGLHSLTLGRRDRTNNCLDSICGFS